MKREIARLKSEEFDVLVVGGGIYGAALAREAVTRGLKAALIEKNDFASATSSQSNKIIHGGIRYLKHGDITRIRESVTERRMWLRTAPGMVRPMQFVIPSYNDIPRSKLLMAGVLSINDLLAYDRNRDVPQEHHIPAGRLIDKDECMAMIPGIAAEGLTGGAIWWDGFVYDTERLVLHMITSAASYGLAAANYVEMLDHVGNEGRICGVRARDSVNNETFAIRSRMTINAIGPWSRDVLDKLRSRAAAELKYAAAMNIIVKGLDHGAHSIGLWSTAPYKDEDAFLSKTKRLFFSTPWRGYAIIGTRFTEYGGPPDGEIVKDHDVRTFINEINEAYPHAALKREHVTLVHKGLLPASQQAVGLGDVQLDKHYRIIDHEREDGMPGVVTVVGVKYTTARDVAEKTIDRIVTALQKGADRSVTQGLPLLRGEGVGNADYCRAAVAENKNDLSPQTILHLIRYYGQEYARVIECARGRNDLLQPILGSSVTIKAQVIFAIRQECARTLLDVIARRTELGSAECPPDAVLQECGRIMGDELGWDDDKIRAEIASAQEYMGTHTRVCP